MGVGRANVDHAVSVPANSRVIECPGSMSSLAVGDALLSTGCHHQHFLGKGQTWSQVLLLTVSMPVLGLACVVYLLSSQPKLSRHHVRFVS